MNDVQVQSPEADFPALYKATDKGAILQQTVHFRLVAGEVFSLLGAAAAGVAAGWLPDEPVLRRLAAAIFVVAMLAALGFRVARQVGKQERRWFAARALAESVKSESWQFMMRAAPYASNKDAAERFAAQIGLLLKSDADTFELLAAAPEGASSQITVAMRAIRGKSRAERLAVYRMHRAHDQCRYYDRKAFQHEANGRRWAWFAGGLEATAILGGLMALGAGWPFDFVQVFVTGATGAVAWIHSKDFRRLSTTYRFVAQDLRRLEDKYHSPASDAELQEYVSEVEHTLSREHTYWLSRSFGAAPTVG